MDETGIQQSSMNPMQGGMNQMGMGQGQMNQNNQFDPNMIN